MLQIGRATIEYHWKALPIFSCSPAKVCVTEHIRKPFAGEQEVLRKPLLFYVLLIISTLDLSNADWLNIFQFDSFQLTLPNMSLGVADPATPIS